MAHVHVVGKRGWVPPTLAEVCEGLVGCINADAHDEGNALARLDRQPANTPQDSAMRNQAQADAMMLRGRQAHTREQLSYWRWLLHYHPDLANVDCAVACHRHGQTVPPPGKRHTASSTYPPRSPRHPEMEMFEEPGASG